MEEHAAIIHQLYQFLRENLMSLSIDEYPKVPCINVNLVGPEEMSAGLGSQPVDSPVRGFSIAIDGEHIYITCWDYPSFPLSDPDCYKHILNKINLGDHHYGHGIQFANITDR